MRRGFTLIELMVVVGIIVILATLAVPSIGPMLTANQEAQVINTLNGLLTKAQTTAQAQGTQVALRVERAFKMDERGILENASGVTTMDVASGALPLKPVWLDYQRVRILTYASYKDQTYRQEADSKFYNLPKGFWLAPGYSLNLADGLTQKALEYSPPSDPAGTAATYNLLENFYIVFDSQGELTVTVAEKIHPFADKSQSFRDPPNLVVPKVTHQVTIKTGPSTTKDIGSARSLLIYDRKKWESLPTDDHTTRWQFLANEAKPVYINRALGSIIEGGQ